MRARILGAAAAICLLPVASSAQDGLRSASLPERPLTSTLSPPRGDLFLADPDTYTPRNDRRDLPVPFFGQIPVYWYMTEVLAPYGGLEQPGPLRGTRPTHARRLPHRRDSYVGRVPRSGPAEPPPAAAPAPPPPPLAPGVPKTFYVIAGCYAGDKPPRPEWLPPDCDLSRVRVIPP